MKLRSQPFDKLRAGSQNPGARREKHGTRSIGKYSWQQAAGSRQQEERRKFKGEGVEVVETVKVVIR
jgi:hypothetical protein